MTEQKFLRGKRWVTLTELNKIKNDLLKKVKETVSIKKDTVNK